MPFSILKGMVVSMVFSIPMFAGLGGAMIEPPPFAMDDDYPIEDDIPFGDKDKGKSGSKDKPEDDKVLIDEEGEELYQMNCAACHANDLEGSVGPRLDDIEDSYSKEEIADIALNGIGSMPAGLVGSEEEADMIAEWILEQN